MCRGFVCVEYEVFQVTDHRDKLSHNSREYLVVYTCGDQSWVPAENMNCPLLVHEYFERRASVVRARDKETRIVTHEVLRNGDVRFLVQANGACSWKSDDEAKRLAGFASVSSYLSRYKNLILLEAPGLLSSVLLFL